MSHICFSGPFIKKFYSAKVDTNNPAGHVNYVRTEDNPANVLVNGQAGYGCTVPNPVRRTHLFIQNIGTTDQEIFIEASWSAGRSIILYPKQSVLLENYNGPFWYELGTLTQHLHIMEAFA